MIFVALGANLKTIRYGSVQNGLEAALEYLHSNGIRVICRSSWYRTAPMPISNQPWYINGVASIDCKLSAVELLRELLEVELKFGRIRGVPNASRTLDLDLIDYNGIVTHSAGDEHFPGLQLPHPRLSERGFVLIPLAEIEPKWSHPESGVSIEHLINLLPSSQKIDRIMSRAGANFECK